MRVGGRVLTVRKVRGRRFDFTVSLPRREVTVGVAAIDGLGRGATTQVPHVFGLPRSARPRVARPAEHPHLARTVRALARRFPGTSAVYVADLVTGSGASWNAGARFPAGSTLKVAIAVEVLRTLRGKPPAGSRVDRLLQAMLVQSDNDAANALEVFLAGSTSAGARRVTELMRSLGLRDSEMYGGYARSPARRRPIPVRADEQPAFGLGKSTTARDLARLFALVHLAAGDKGLLAERYRGAFTPSDARYLMHVLAHVADPGKLDRFLRGGPVAVLHKAGWIVRARHDAGLVYWREGVFVVAVMTYGSGVGSASDVLAGRVARSALAAFEADRRRG